MFVVVTQLYAQMDVIGPFNSKKKAESALEKNGWEKDVNEETPVGDLRWVVVADPNSWHKGPKDSPGYKTAKICELSDTSNKYFVQ
jgi:hypothetical protein